MAEEKRNLCAQIPISLHSRVRQEQEASGQTLSEYMTQLITDFFQMKEGNQNMNHDMKTIAFQVPVELFEEFKAYLQRNCLLLSGFCYIIAYKLNFSPPCGERIKEVTYALHRY